MNSESHDFEEFMRQREKASEAYVEGNPEPLNRIVARVSPATFFPPTGLYVRHERGSSEI
jgi:hypothetical protein